MLRRTTARRCWPRTATGPTFRSSPAIRTPDRRSGSGSRESTWRAATSCGLRSRTIGANPILSASAVLWRRFTMTPAMRETMGGMRIMGDWYCYVHAIEHGTIHYTPRKLNYHRRHAESVIGRLLREQRVDGFFEEIARVH